MSENGWTKGPWRMAETWRPPVGNFNVDDDLARITGQPVSFFLPDAEESNGIVGFDRADLALVRRVGSLSSRAKRALETFLGELDLAA